MQSLARHRIERAERLVQQHDARLGRQRPRHADPLLLPTRQLPRPPVAHVGIEVHQVQQMTDPRRDAVPPATRAAPA